MGLLDYTMFLKESLILEAMTAWKIYVHSELEKFLPGSSALKGETGELRANFGEDPGVAEDKILRFFRDHLGFIDAKIEDIGTLGKTEVAYTQYDGKAFTQKTAMIGSDSFPTYKITFDDNTFYVTNTGAKGKSIGKKKTTPSELQLTGIQFYDANTLAAQAIQTIQGKVNEKVLYPPAADYMIDCVESVLAKEFAEKWDDANALLADPGNWSRPIIELSKAHEGLSSGDINDIVNDFGELLDGIFLLNTVKNVTAGYDESLHGLIFPRGSNYPLADILLDGVRISSKAEKGGGRPSLQPIIEEIAGITPGIMHSKGISLTPEELELKNIFDHINKELKAGQWLDSVEVYLYFARQLANIPKYMPAPAIIQERLDYLEGSIGADISRPSVIAFLDSMTAGEKKIWLEKYWKDTGFKIKKAINYKDAGKDLIAAIYYPLAGEVVDVLNNWYGAALTALVRKFVSYKQIYLGIDAKQDPDTLRFSGISSAVIPSVKFVARASASNWNAGIGFELKL